jgi:hypothetical protein
MKTIKQEFEQVLKDLHTGLDPRRFTCVYCERVKPDVCMVFNPYQYDIYDKRILERMCNECYYESCMDI